jgi:hypothetical protein
LFRLPLRKKLPRSTPDYHGFGDESEAVCFTANGAAAWHATPGAVAWLAATARRTVEQAKGQIKKNIGKAMAKLAK